MQAMNSGCISAGYSQVLIIIIIITLASRSARCVWHKSCLACRHSGSCKHLSHHNHGSECLKSHGTHGKYINVSMQVSVWLDNAMPVHVWHHTLFMDSMECTHRRLHLACKYQVQASNVRDEYSSYCMS